MRIGELARLVQCDVETVRYYEREGLLPPPSRTISNYRAYAKEDLERLQFIRRCRSLDMNLAEIRTLLHFRDSPREDCGGVNRLLDQHLQHVATRLAELSQLQKQLRLLRRQCVRARAAKDCGILSDLAAARSATPVSAMNVKGLRGKH